MFSGMSMLSDEQVQLKEACARWVDKSLKPIAAEIDRSNEMDTHGLMQQLGELGMVGVTIPEEYGGTGLGYLEHCIVMEEVSRGSGGFGLSYVAHSNLCANQIALNGSQEQKQKYLPKLCTGEHIGALAMSETGSGSDVLSMKLKAEKVDGGHLLNGNKFWITNGPCADTLVIYARTDMEDRTKGVTAFLVEKDFNGFSTGKKLDKLGIRGSETSELIFDDCFVPDENILGKIGGGVRVLMSGLNYERLVLSAGPVGIMQACLDECMPYVTQRKQFGTQIGEFQLIQKKMADIYTAIVSSRMFMYGSAVACDKGESSNMECASVFLYTAEQGTQVALEAMQIFGGNGYINDYPLGRFLRDAKLYEIGGGTSEVRRMVIAEQLLSMAS